MRCSNMDQDVEAILNASDSEGDENLNVHGVSLEDILREDDGGEEYLDDGESGGIGDLHDDMPRLDRCGLSVLHLELPFRTESSSP